MELNSRSLVFSANTEDHKTLHVSVEWVPFPSCSLNCSFPKPFVEMRTAAGWVVSVMAERLSAPGSRSSWDYQGGKCKCELSRKWQSHRSSFLPTLCVRLKSSAGWRSCCDVGAVRAEPAFSPFFQHVAECRVEQNILPCNQGGSLCSVVPGGYAAFWSLPCYLGFTEVLINFAVKCSRSARAALWTGSQGEKLTSIVVFCQERFGLDIMGKKRKSLEECLGARINCLGNWWSHCLWKCSGPWVWHSGMCFRGDYDGVRLMAWLDDLESLFQPCWFCDSAWAVQMMQGSAEKCIGWEKKINGVCDCTFLVTQ